MILFHHLIYTPALSDGEMIDPVADLSFAEQRTSLIGEYLVEFALFSGRLDILKRGFVDDALVKFVRSLKTQKFSDRLYPSKRILFEILKGSVENVVDSILAAELGFISTLVVEERSVLDLARYKSFEVVGQVSREIVEFESAVVVVEGNADVLWISRDADDFAAIGKNCLG